MSNDRATAKKGRRRGRPPRREQFRFNLRARRKFLAALAQAYSPGEAARRAGISRSQAYRVRAADPQFAAEWDEALEAGTDLLEDELRRRGKEGWLEPVYYRGRVVGHVRRYSDTMLAMALNARRPEKFKYRAEVTQKSEPIDLSRLTDAELEQLQRIREKLMRKEGAPPDATDAGAADPTAPVH